MYTLQGITFPGARGFSWQIHHDKNTGDGVRIVFTHQNAMHSVAEVHQLLLNAAGKDGEWFVPVAGGVMVDLDSLSSQLNPSPNLPWLSGVVKCQGSVRIENGNEFRRDQPFSPTTIFTIELTEETVKENKYKSAGSIPPAIQESLRELRTDHPDPMNVAFLMMRFGETNAHKQSEKIIKEAFSKHGIAVLRADDKEYHDDLLPNIQTYMHGCGIGVALFERIESNEFNPNMSLEIGYMIALGKPICLLKDKTLPSLPTDLVSRLYRTFDTYDAKKTIPPAVDRWIQDKGLGQRRP